MCAHAADDFKCFLCADFRYTNQHFVMIIAPARLNMANRKYALETNDATNGPPTAAFCCAAAQFVAWTTFQVEYTAEPAATRAHARDTIKSNAINRMMGFR